MSSLIKFGRFFSLQRLSLNVSFACLWVPESDTGQQDVGPLSECVLCYLRDLPSPVIPPCIYPHLQAAVTLQQQVLQQSAGRPQLMSFNMTLTLTKHILLVRKGFQLNVSLKFLVNGPLTEVFGWWKLLIITWLPTIFQSKLLFCLLHELVTFRRVFS